MIEFVLDKEKKESIAKEILFNLPEWFGLPESTETYISESKDYPFWASYDNQKNANGFIVLKQNSEVTCEIYVMGVLKSSQHKGIGFKLWESFYDYAQKKGYLYVQVKTVQSGRYKNYDITNAFYKKIGFKEFELMPNLWDEWNPCQIYVQYIG